MFVDSFKLIKNSVFLIQNEYTLNRYVYLIIIIIISKQCRKQQRHEVREYQHPHRESDGSGARDEVLLVTACVCLFVRLFIYLFIYFTDVSIETFSHDKDGS